MCMWVPDFCLAAFYDSYMCIWVPVWPWFMVHVIYICRFGLYFTPNSCIWDMLYLVLLYGSHKAYRFYLALHFGSYKQPRHPFCPLLYISSIYAQSYCSYTPIYIYKLIQEHPYKYACESPPLDWCYFICEYACFTSCLDFNVYMWSLICSSSMSMFAHTHMSMPTIELLPPYGSLYDITAYWHTYVH